MILEIATQPAIEPITLAEVKLHLRVDSGSFADNITESQSIVPNNHATNVGYVLEGTGVDVLGTDALVILNAGALTGTGTVDCKIQESDDNITYTDWTGGAFVQVTTANDNAIQEIAYTGSLQYIRTVANILNEIADFGTTVIERTATTIEDVLLGDDIKSVRQMVEEHTRRALLSQTWDYYFDSFPAANNFKIPFGNLQSVTHIKYTNSAGTPTTMTVSTDYLVETNGENIGRIVLPFGVSWPSFTPYPSKPIVVRFVAGWTTAALLPEKIRQAVKLGCEDLYANRSSQIISPTMEPFAENVTFIRLLASSRLWDDFR